VVGFAQKSDLRRRVRRLIIILSEIALRTMFGVRFTSDKLIPRSLDDNFVLAREFDQKISSHQPTKLQQLLLLTILKNR
jgi:hypothetical protein